MLVSVVSLKDSVSRKKYRGIVFKLLYNIACRQMLISLLPRNFHLLSITCQLVMLSCSPFHTIFTVVLLFAKNPITVLFISSAKL